MANLLEGKNYPKGIYQLESTDPVFAGPDGISNRQAQELATRTKWLKEKLHRLEKIASDTEAGLIRMATEQEVIDGEDRPLAVNPFQLNQSFLTRPAYAFIASDDKSRLLNLLAIKTTGTKIPLEKAHLDQYNMLEDSCIKLPCKGYFHLYIEGHLNEKEFSSTRTIFGWHAVESKEVSGVVYKQSITRQDGHSRPYARLSHSTLVWGERGAKFYVKLLHTDTNSVDYDRTSTYAHGHFVGV